MNKNSFVNEVVLEKSKKAFSGKPIQKTLAILAEGSVTADIEAYASLLRTVIERVGVSSVLPLISSVVPATSSKGKIPVISLKYGGLKGDTVKTDVVKVVTVSDSTLYADGDIVMSAAGAEGEVLYKEEQQILVKVTSATQFAISDELLKSTDIVGESLGLGDGVTTTFAFANSPIVTDSVSIYLDTVLQDPSTYTIDYVAGSVTFLVAPALNVAISADYSYGAATAVTISNIRSNTVGVGGILKNYSGDYTIAQAEALDETNTSVFSFELSHVDVSCVEKKARTGLTEEMLRDYLVMYGEAGKERIIKMIINAIEQETEQKYFDFIKLAATQFTDLILTNSYGTQTSLKAVYFDIINRINMSIGRIGTNTNINGRFFVVASSNVVGAIRTATPLKADQNMSSLNSKFAGIMPNGAILIEDPYALSDYFLVGNSGMVDYDNGGAIYSPYYIDFIEAVNPDTLQKEIAVVISYDFNRSQLDTKTGNGSSDFFELTSVDFSSLANY